MTPPRMRLPFADDVEIATVRFDPNTAFPATFETTRFKARTVRRSPGRVSMFDWHRFGTVTASGRVGARWADEPGPWLKMRYQRVITGVELDEPVRRARAAIAAAR